jgi:CDGSH-type Zn-finger protein
MKKSRPPSDVVITAYPNGPLLVRGDVGIVESSGEEIPQRRRTMALCRCGASAIKPFCDGSHKLIGFRTDTDTEDKS